MPDFQFLSNTLPRGASPDRVRLGMEQWADAVGQENDPTLQALSGELMASPDGRRLLEAVFGNSPYLTLAMTRDPRFALDLMTRGADAIAADIMASLAALRAASAEGMDIGRALRIAKRRMALTVAMADIAGDWPLQRVTGALSSFADAAIGVAAAGVLRGTAAAGHIELVHPDDPERDSGLVILGMGKLGAGELNYSSDVDLIILFDPERMRTREPDRLLHDVVRLTRTMVKLLEERTAEGNVFRIDLRLRPDPGSTPVALSVLAAEIYYESLGQNWERAAMIKARPVAGDIAAGRQFLARLQPYVWRKSLDFAAIQDIHSIKRQINAHRGGGKIAVAGHNVKLGRGGIREIEFFAQTQQLIWGGRQPELRCRGTLEALEALTALGHVAEATRRDLADSYAFLRRTEHRLQMIDDEQTHSLPDDAQGLEEIAVFMGFDGRAAFSAEIERHLRQVETHYARLFEDAPQLAATGKVGGNLVFTGSEADPETIRTLAGLGFKSPDTVDAAVRGWHHGRYRAMRSARARELLTELMPVLLSALAKTADPDATLRNFDSFLSALPAGVQLFSMFHANPQLLELVAEIMGGAPRLAQHLSRKPTILDSVLTGDFFSAPPPPDALEAELARLLGSTEALEEALDVTRRWAHDRQFQVGVQLLRRFLPPRAAAVAFSNIADAALKALHPVVEAEFVRNHGRFPGAGMTCIALGKLGGREMTPTSDLDLIFVYDTPAGTEASDGPRPLPPSQYFARLSQRLINAVTAQTAEGRLFEVDMRLRPSGAKGPIASSLTAFIQYHEQAAWTWEHMALTRARVVFGPKDLWRRVEEVIHQTLTRPRNPDVLLRDVADMRVRLDAEHHSDFVWEVKHMRGGQVDIDFIAQYLQLRHAHSHPQVLSANTRTALRALRDDGLLAPPVADSLIAALDLWQGVQSVLRLTIEGYFRAEREAEVTEGLGKTLAAVGAAADVTALKEKIRATAAAVHGHFRDLVENPARDLPGKDEE